MPLKSVIALVLSVATLVLLWYVFAGPRTPPVSTPAPQDDYPSRDWNDGRREKLNISLFTFNDHNRNGRYDLGDSPLASIVVRATRPDGSVVSTRSNINGYANFSMLHQNASADINRADSDIRLAVSVPPQWQLSTANGEQTIRFLALNGSPSGLIAQQPPVAVGLMPQLRVTGRVLGYGERQPQLIATGPDGTRQALELDKDHTFTFEGQPGEWTLVASDSAANLIHQRTFTVTNTPVQLSAIDLDESTVNPLAHPLIADFEEWQRAALEKLPGGWSGLGWDYMIATDNQFYRGPGYVNGLRSGKMVAYNSSGHPVTITPDVGDDSFDFVGAYFSAAWPAAHGERLQVKAWRDGQLVGEDEISLSMLGPVWFQADYHQIDKLLLSTTHYWQFVVDDMAFGLASAPESGSAGQSHAD